MKKLVSPLPTGGAPLFGTETVVDVLQTEVWDIVEGLMSSINYMPLRTIALNPDTQNAFILTGGVVTHPATDLYDITSGIVYFPAAKAFARFPQVVNYNPPGTFNFGILELLDPVIEQKTFADAALKDYFTIRNARIVTSSSATHQMHFALNATSAFIGPRFDEVYKYPFTQTAYNLGNTAIQVYDIGVWNMNTTASVTLTGTTTPLYPKTDIVGLQVIIRSDLLAGNARAQYPLDYLDVADNPDQVSGYWAIVEHPADNGFDVVLSRPAGSFFISADFDGVTESRGKVIVTFKSDAAWSTT